MDQALDQAMTKVQTQISTDLVLFVSFSSSFASFAWGFHFPQSRKTSSGVKPQQQRELVASFFFLALPTSSR